MSLSIYARTPDGTIDLTLRGHAEAILRGVISAEAGIGWIEFTSADEAAVVLRVPFPPHVAEAVARAFNDALAAPTPAQEAAE